jgi:hypothetical protein
MEKNKEVTNIYTARQVAIFQHSHFIGKGKPLGWYLAEWLERLTVNCQNRNSPEFNPSILRHSGIRRAADEAMFIKEKVTNGCKKNLKSDQMTPSDELKVHKIENFFDSDFGMCVISLLVMSKY